MNIGLVVRPENEDAASVARKIVPGAEERGLLTQIVDEHADATLDTCDVVIAVGGDGTVLEAAQEALRHGAPILGVNVGRVGFLADAEPADIDLVLDLVRGGTWTESARMTVAASIDGGPRHWGLNDVVIEKTRSQQLVSLEVHIEGERFLTYRADGIVFSAPTGSTAYNLSAGGPIVDSSLEALIVTPVAPYSRFSSSLVLPPTARIECVVTHDRPAGVTVDGRDLGVLEPGQRVSIHRGEHSVRFIDLNKHSYTQTVKSKLRLYEGLDGDSF
jgi:NAD+ kinase